MNQKDNKKNLGVIIALGVAIALGVVVLVIAISSVAGTGDNSLKKDDTTKYELTTPTDTSVSDTESSVFDFYGSTEQGAGNQGVANQGGDNVAVQPDNNVEAGDTVVITTTEKATGGYDPVAEYEKLTKNGDNILSDHHNNKYIKLVVNKYNVEAERLVAIYSEPDTGNNFVLEFRDTKDDNGNIVKSPDTLHKVYLIDKDKNISIATGTTTGNVGVSYAEGTLCFHMVKSIVMPQYPDYFTGVED